MCDRRTPVLASVVAVVMAILPGACGGSPQPASRPTPGPLVVATWPFGKIANDVARERLLAGASPLDAVEAGIRQIETLGSDGSVGLGGRPNAAGYPQLDACIMDGVGHRAGSVAAVEGIVHPISAARHVMDDSRHVMLVGEGARWFALEKGLETIDVADYSAKKQAWTTRAGGSDDPSRKTDGHDTIALLVLGADGRIAGGCSTSGAGNKLPGRVGDSPILGSGLYVDGEVGAAGATGLGENVMRWCASYQIVELMRAGLHPQAACEEVIHRIAREDPRGYQLDICFIALDKQGRFGAAASNQAFPFAVATGERSEIVKVPPVEPR